MNNCYEVELSATHKLYEKLTESSTEFTGNPQKSQKSKEDLGLNKLILPSGHCNRIFSPYLGFLHKVDYKIESCILQVVQKTELYKSLCV